MDQGDWKGEARSAEVSFVSRKEKREKKKGVFSEKRALPTIISSFIEIFSTKPWRW